MPLSLTLEMSPRGDYCSEGQGHLTELDILRILVLENDEQHG